MSDNLIPAKGGSFLRRKVAGVPVLYLLGAGAVVLVVYAWRTKSTKTTTPVATAGDAVTGTTGTTALATTTTGSPYDTLTAGDGTVYASAGQVPDQTAATPAITTNADWLNKGVAYLVTTMSVSGGDAQNALQTYLAGGQLSIQQGQWRDAVIKEYGLPPTPSSGSSVAPAKSLGLFIYRPNNTQFAVYELFSNMTARWVSYPEWMNLTDAQRAAAKSIDRATLSQYGA